MRTFLAAVFALHGLIHFLGVANAIRPGSVPQLTRVLIALPPRVQAIGWGVAGALFLAVAVTMAFELIDWWHLLGAAAVVSQFMIITAWPDAKFGTVANVIAVLTLVVAGSLERFDRKAADAMRQLGEPPAPTAAVTIEELEALPQPIAHWLKTAGVVGRPRAQSVTLEQTGEMRTSPEGGWSQVEAHQRFTVEPPGFVWHAKVNMWGVPVRGLDRYLDGKGRMQISALGLLPLVDAADERIDEGTLLRWLGEIVWFPSAALSPRITWEPIDERRARATLRHEGVTGSAVFTIDELGRFASMEALRFCGGGPDAKRERWVVPATAWRRIDGILVPVEGAVTWKLASGEFTYFRWKIADVHAEAAAPQLTALRPTP